MAMFTLLWSVIQQWEIIRKECQWWFINTSQNYRAESLSSKHCLQKWKGIRKNFAIGFGMLQCKGSGEGVGMWNFIMPQQCSKQGRTLIRVHQMKYRVLSKNVSVSRMKDSVWEEWLKMDQLHFRNLIYHFFQIYCKSPFRSKVNPKTRKPSLQIGTIRKWQHTQSVFRVPAQEQAGNGPSRRPAQGTKV